MRAEIIAVGTELLLGQIVNTNAQYLSEELAKIGIDVYFHTVVGDNRARLCEVIQQAQTRADLLVFSGGLGPTEDDLTKETVADIAGVPLEIHAESLRRMEQFFSSRGRTMTDNNRKQALVFAGGTVFLNDNGTAPGVALTSGAHHYVLLPGPPRELKPMFRNDVLPYLRSLLPAEEVVHSRVLRFFGIGESQLETEIVDIIRAQRNPTIAPLAKEGEVTVRLTAKASSAKEAEALMAETEKRIRARVGRYLYGVNDTSLADVVVDQLRTAKQTVAVAESCTGGLASHMLTQVPGSSAVFSGGIVCYSVGSKRQLLGVPEEVLATCGTVSETTARLLAEGAKDRFGSDYGIGITGVAGPDAVEDKPVGHVFIALARPTGETVVKLLKLAGLRPTIQANAAKQALFLLYKYFTHTLKNER